MFVTIALANTSVLSHSYHSFLRQEHLRSTVLANFKHIK